MKYFSKQGPNRHWLTLYGFSNEVSSIIGMPCQYETCIHDDNDLYSLWLSIDFARFEAHVYVEFDCGGEVSRDTISLSHIDMNDESQLMPLLDEIVDEYLPQQR